MKFCTRARSEWGAAAASLSSLASVACSLLLAVHTRLRIPLEGLLRPSKIFSLQARTCLLLANLYKSTNGDPTNYRRRLNARTVLLG